jgi:hypothetical protein
LKLFQEWWQGRIKENDGGSEFMYDIFDMINLINCKNICKCHNGPAPSTTTTKKKLSMINKN